MKEFALQIQNLCISFNGQLVVDHVSCQIRKGKTLAIVGESGSGKSVTALAVLGLLPPSASIKGQIEYGQDQLLNMTPSKLRKIRGGEIAMIFQEPMTSLNPVFSIGEQIEEAVRVHHRISRKNVRARTRTALEEVGLSVDRLGAYPHEFSGGMQQRVMIAMALASEPALLIADEPTTALDATTSKQIIDVLCKAKQRRGMSMMFISHDLTLVASIADDICVMRNGIVMEVGEAKRVLLQPSNAYTRALLACKPSLKSRRRRLQTITDFAT